MNTTFSAQHVAMLLTYSGISFISGAVNHGFFSGARSLWTAAIGILLFVAGVLMTHRGQDAKRETLGRTLLWGTLLSIGLGFFTGGLQHFPDSPARSAWVVPLGFAISAAALLVHGEFTHRRTDRGAMAYVAVVGVVVLAGSLGAARWLDAHPQLAGHSHGPAEASPALVGQVVTRSVEVKMLDAMRFEPASIQVAAGETLRIVARNVGQVEHELVLGSPSEIREHAEVMKRGEPHAHGHAGGAAIKVAPGGVGELVVTFREPTTLTMACLIPGHFEAGMTGRVQVARADGAAVARPAAEPVRPGHDHSGHDHSKK